VKRVFLGPPPGADAVGSGPRWERAFQREQAIGPVTPGHHLEVPGRTLAQQVRILQTEGHPLSPSLQTLAGWRKVYLDGGRRVQALLDSDRGGKGNPRGWLANPEHQTLVIACEKALIGTSKTEYPPASVLRAQIVGRLGAAFAKAVSGPRALDRFRQQALSRADRAMLAGGERRYRETVMPKPPAPRAERHGEIWVSDHRQCDNLVYHGQKSLRPWVTAIIDAYSGAWIGIHVSPHDPGSAEIALALRNAILPKPEDPEGLLCGLPDSFYADWGKDFASTHLRLALTELSIQISHARPYSPWAKGHVEGNAFATMSKCFDLTVPGYVGRNTSERPHGAKAVLSFAAFCNIVTQWALVEFNRMVFQKRRLEQQPASRLDFARAHRVPVRLPQKDTLLLSLMKRERRVVTDGGISLGGLCTLWHPALWTLAEERAEVEIRYDPADMARAFIFHRGELVCQAVDARAAEVGLTEQDARTRMKLRGERIKALKAAGREDRVAAMDADTYFEHRQAQQVEMVPALAAAGGGSARPIRQMIPHLDRAAQQLRRPGRPSGPRPLVSSQDAEERLPDLADKPLPPGWE
jgi:putative transposase